MWTRHPKWMMIHSELQRIEKLQRDWKQVSARKGLSNRLSTLLCNLLAQNPRFHATATSGILEVLFQVRTSWDNTIEFKAMKEAESNAARLRVMRGALAGFFDDIEKPIIFDKSRGWCAYIEMAENILQRPVKILVPVRDVRDVLVSFEKLWRNETGTHQIAAEQGNFFKFQSLGGRCEVWCDQAQPVGLAYNRVKDAVTRGFSDRMCFVEYERLTSEPAKVIKEVYDFLGEAGYQHDFDNVEQVTQEDDRVHGFHNLHTIRAKIAPQPSAWETMLGADLGKKYAGLSFWK